MEQDHDIVEPPHQPNMEKSHGERQNTPPLTLRTEEDAVVVKPSDKKLADLKYKFNRCLEKLQSLDTRISVLAYCMQGLAELKALVDKQRSRQALHIYLSQLKVSKAVSAQALQAQLSLLASIATFYKQSLVDSSDKPPSLAKTAVRFVGIVLRYLRCESEIVAAGCSSALSQLHKECLGGITDQEVIALIFAPLKQIITSNSEKPLQQSAANCLNNLLEGWGRDHKRLVRAIFKDVVVMFNRHTPKLYEIHSALEQCLLCCGLQQLDPERLQILLRRIVTALGEKHSQVQIRSYMGRVTLCRLLGLLGRLAKQNSRTVDRQLTIAIAECLTGLAQDRVVHVQDQAKSAAKQWTLILTNSLQNNKAQTPTPQSRMLQSLVEARHSFKTNKYALNQTNKQPLESSDARKRHQSAKHGFVMKGSGIGGGYFRRTIHISPPAKMKSAAPTELQRIIKSAKQSQRKDPFSSVGPLEVKVMARHGHVEAFDMQKVDDQVDKGLIDFGKQEGQQQHSQRSSSGKGIQVEQDEGDQGMAPSEFPAKEEHKHGSMEPINTKKAIQDMSGVENTIQPKVDVARNELGQFKLTSRQSEAGRADEARSPIAKIKEQVVKNEKLFASPRTAPKKVEPRTEQKRAMTVVLQPSQVPQILERVPNFENVSSCLGDVLTEGDMQDLSLCMAKDSQLEIVNEQQCLQQVRTARLKKLKQSMGKFTKPSGPSKQVQSELPKERQPEAQLNRFERTIKQEVQKYNVQKDIEEFIRKPWLAQSRHNPNIYEGDEVGEGENSQQQNQRNRPTAKKQTPNQTSSQFLQQSSITMPSQRNQLNLSEWKQILKEINKGSTSQAFEHCLALDDDMYLLRLLLMSEPDLSQLSYQSIRQLWQRFSVMHSSNFVQAVSLQLFEQAAGLGLLTNSLTMKEGQSVLQDFYNLSGRTKGKLSYKAAVVYNQLQKTLRC